MKDLSEVTFWLVSVELHDLTASPGLQEWERILFTEIYINNRPRKKLGRLSEITESNVRSTFRS